MTNSEAQDALRRFAGTRDPAAFEQLVKGHIDLVYAAARRQVGDSATADDVTQQVFVLLANKAAKLSDAVRLPGWLLRTCRHCASDANRARLRRSHHEQEAAAMKSQTASIDPDTQEILRQVDAALADLGETDRTAIAMRYLQQRSVREIADALKVSEDAAKKRLSRAMERLRGRLAPLRTAITVTALAAALEQAASITAPPAMASTIAIASLSSKASISSGLLIHGIAMWKIGVAVAAVILLSATGVTFWLMKGSSNQPLAVNPPVGRVAPVKLLPMPAVASLTPQQRRIYQLLGSFRTEVPFKADEWAGTLREITQIGRPAVPALCVELDRTDRDVTQRLLIMALRIIGDPRAVPSIIDAIPRVPLSSTDFGVHVTDPDLRKFIDSNHWDPWNRPWTRPQMSAFNRGITDCIAALETITKHSEGYEPIMGDLTVEQRKQFADRWLQWWTQHTDSSVDLNSIDAVRYDGDLVAAVAAATTPPLFPSGPPMFSTGSAIHLSAARELDVAVQGTWDAPAYLNFSTGQLLYKFQGRRNAGPEGNDWFHDAGVDVFGTVSGDSPYGAAGQAMLTCYSMKTWMIDNARFDKIDDEVRNTLPILADAKGPGKTLQPMWDRDGKFQFPVTFLFQTSNNRLGILQEVGPINGESGIHIRYRLWPDATGTTQPASQPTTSQPTQSANDVIPPGAAFGAIHEMTLFDPQSGQPASLNLATGKTVPQVIDVANPSWTQAKADWAIQSGVDLSTILSAASHDVYGLMETSGRLISAPVSDAAWDQMSPQNCATIASRARLFADQKFGLLTLHKKQIPGGSNTWVVSSANGADVVGLIQITELQPTELKLRYKIVEIPSVK